MLSVSSAKDADYYSNLAAEDYYSGGTEPPGHWFGAGASRLGLDGKVQAGELAKLFQGFDPMTGAKLVPNAGEDSHKSAWDFTFSCPKSVSAIWAVADQSTKEAISEANRRASEKAMDYFSEAACFTRHGHGGHHHESAKDQVIVASFEHSSSRNGEPQLHRHCLLMNATPDGRALDINLRAKMAAGALFRIELSHELQAMGFAIEQVKQEFQVCGVPAALLESWSSRRKEIENFLSKDGFSSAKASELACLATRNAKAFYTREGLEKAWQAQAQEHEFRVEDCLSEVQEKLEIPTAESVFNSLTARASTFTVFQLDAEVFRQCQGVMDAEKALELRDQILADAVTLQARDGVRYTSQEMLRIESEIIEIAQAKQDERHPVDHAKRDRIAADKGLSPEQKNMLHHVTNTGGVSCVEGMAGTGKSYALGAAREVWEGAGYRVLGLAPTAKAAAGLQEGSGIKSSTIHLALAQIRHEKLNLDSKTILIVDEAGMCGSRLVHPLLKEAAASGAKVVFVGDSQQLQPIDAGGAFRALSKRLGAAELVDIRRQKVTWLKEAVQDFAAGKAGKALAKYRAGGALRTAKTASELYKKMVTDWHRSEAIISEKIMLAGSNAEVQKLNDLARETWKSAGRLHGPSCVVAGKEFVEGDRLVFLKNNRSMGLQNGTRATLERINFNNAGRLELTVMTDEGRRTTFQPSNYDHFTHGYAMTAHKAQGMTTDACFFAVHERMSDREWSYVAASRARHEANIYATESMEEILDKTMSMSHQKETTLDYQLAANQSEALENRFQSQNKQQSLVYLQPEEELDFD